MRCGRRERRDNPPMTDTRQPLGHDLPHEPMASAERVRQACLAAALQAWEDAGCLGLCAEGRWEAAVSAVRSLDLQSCLDPPHEDSSAEPAAPAVRDPRRP